jgi:acyl-CoA synthetase (AMP-forming)/AMP-acid ligase II
MLLTEILPRARLLWPDVEAVVCGSESLTYAEVADRVARLAAGLADLGVEPGDRVAVLHRNCHRMLEASFAVVHLGAVLVPLNCRLTASDLAFILDDTSAGVLVADDGWAGLTEEAAAAARRAPTIVWSRLGGRPGDGVDLEDLIAETESTGLPDGCADEHDPAAIYYTSGTTGHQKGVVLTHRNNASHALATIAELGLSDRDTWAHVAPMFHLADAWATWAISMVGGRHVMIGAFEPGAVLHELAERRVTVSNLIPTMLNDLVHHADAAETRLPCFRLVMSGGAPISPQLVRRVIETFRCEYVQTYGLTETSPYLTFSLLKEHLTGLPEDEQMRTRSKTGRPALGVSLRVVDDDGRDVPADGRAVGEIIARGDRITPGYWRRPDLTEEAFRDGWFLTGDLATIDAEGYLDIVDRKKDVILTGGELVYTTEVENALCDHPAVLEAAVVGSPDERLGETVTAFVVHRPGVSVEAGELIGHCRGRLAHYKCPRRVENVESLPRTGSGKISKKVLRERCRRGGST